MRVKYFTTVAALIYRRENSSPFLTLRLALGMRFGYQPAAILTMPAPTISEHAPTPQRQGVDSTGYASLSTPLSGSLGRSERRRSAS